MNLAGYWAASKRECTSHFTHTSGGSIHLKATTLLGDGLIPSSENTKPKNSKRGGWNFHFLGLKVRVILGTNLMRLAISRNYTGLCMQTLVKCNDYISGSLNDTSLSEAVNECGIEQLI